MIGGEAVLDLDAFLLLEASSCNAPFSFLSGGSLSLKVDNIVSMFEDADSLSTARDSEDGSFPSISSSELRNASFDFLTLLLLANRGEDDADADDDNDANGGNGSTGVKALADESSITCTNDMEYRLNCFICRPYYGSAYFFVLLRASEVTELCAVYAENMMNKRWRCQKFENKNGEWCHQQECCALDLIKTPSKK